MLKNNSSKYNFAWLIIIPIIIGLFYLISNADKKTKPKPKKQTFKAATINTRNIALSNKIKIEKAQKRSLPKKGAAKNSANSKLNTPDTSSNKPTKSPSVESKKKANPKKETKNNQPPATKKEIGDISQAKVTLTIDKGLSSKNYPVTVSPGSTVLDVLKKASSVNGFSLKYKNYSYGAFIEEIDGLSNDKTNATYWLYYINSKLANLGASSQKIKEGDKIKWKYEKTN